MPPNASADAAVGPLERGLFVLRVLAHAPGGRLRPSDVARRTGLARSPVDRIATTLIRLGYLREEDRELVLAPRVMELGSAYLRGSGVAGALGPLAAGLADELDESVSLAVPDGDAVRFVSQTARRRTLSVAFRIGDALPAERCAPGALFGADWDEERFAAWRARHAADPDDAGFPAVPRPAGGHRDEADFRARIAEAARRGWAEDDQLIEAGLVAVAVPVRDRDGAVVCALSVVSHTSRHDAAGLATAALDAMRRTAERMTGALMEWAARPPGPAAVRPEASAAAKRELGPEYLQSLARGLAVLGALGAAPGGMTLSAVAESTALPRATARRSLLTLQRMGYVACRVDRFSPLPRVLDLGYPLLSALPLGALAQPHLADLVRKVHESASVAVLDGDDIRYVARVAAGRIMSVTITVGTRFPAHATSMGRVLLAGLPAGERAAWLARAKPAPLTAFTLTTPDRLGAALEQVGREGYAMVDQELEEGLRSVAVPVRGGNGEVIAAVNVSLHAERTSAREARETILPALRDAAERITADAAAVYDRQSPTLG
jgi:IclR family pca regulon transcriptional regulator